MKISTDPHTCMYTIQFLRCALLAWRLIKQAKLVWSFDTPCCYISQPSTTHGLGIIVVFCFMAAHFGGTWRMG